MKPFHLLFLTLTICAIAGSAFGQCSDTVQALADHLAQYPESDTDGDGLLCQDELIVHQAFLFKLQTLEMLEGQITLHEDLEYATHGDTSMVLDLWLPIEIDPDDPPLLVIWLHGGGWRTGSKDENRLAWLAPHNFAIASVEFRSVGDIPFPANVHDIKGALRWLRANQDNYGYDARRIGIGGTSSGGHLAALVGSSGEVAELEGNVGNHPGQSSRVEAVLDIAGVIDILTWRDPPGVITSALGIIDRDAPGVEELVEISNPSTHLTQDDPPYLIYHGINDNVVDVIQAVDFHDTLLYHGLESQLQILDVGHLSPLFFNGERADTIVAFFSRHLRSPLETSVQSTTRPQAPSLYPSPTHGILNISSEVEPTSVTIYSHNGEVLAKYQGQNTYDVSQLSPGLHLVEIRDQNGQHLLRMLKL